MQSWIAWLIAACSTAAWLFLWFQEVRRTLQARKSTVDSAALQLNIYRRQLSVSPHDPSLAAILSRSEHIYRQAVNHYNAALRSFWFRLPGHLLGFRTLPESDNTDTPV